MYLVQLNLPPNAFYAKKRILSHLILINHAIVQNNNYKKHAYTFKVSEEEKMF